LIVVLLYLFLLHRLVFIIYLYLLYLSRDIQIQRKLDDYVVLFIDRYHSLLNFDDASQYRCE